MTAPIEVDPPDDPRIDDALAEMDRQEDTPSLEDQGLTLGSYDS